jgi:hypothetical protein
LSDAKAGMGRRCMPLQFSKDVDGQRDGRLISSLAFEEGATDSAWQTTRSKSTIATSRIATGLLYGKTYVLATRKDIRPEVRNYCARRTLCRTSTPLLQQLWQHRRRNNNRIPPR